MKDRRFNLPTPGTTDSGGAMFSLKWQFIASLRVLCVSVVSA